MTSSELTCQELVELVTDYLEGALSSADVARFDEHLSGCDGCRAYLKQMGLTIRTLGELTEESIDPQARDELLGLFRDWKAR
ncbi:MAG: anti-sigma factor family protein [Thermomicrobiales bacterium]